MHATESEAGMSERGGPDERDAQYPGRMLRRVVPLVVLVIAPFLAGCAERKTERDPPTFIRLTDLVAKAKVVAATDLTDREALERDSMHQFVRETFASLDPETTHLVDPELIYKLVPDLEPSEDPPQSRTDGSDLLLEPPSLYVQVFPLASVKTIHGRLSLRGDPEKEPLLIEARAVPTPEELKRDLAELLAPRGVSRHAFLEGAEPSSDGRRTYSVSFRPRIGTKALMFVVATLRNPLVIEDLTIARQPRVSSLALSPSDEFDTPLVRRVEIAHDHRESILLAAPSQIRFELDVPRRSPRLRFARTVLENDGVSGVLEVAVRAGSRELRVRLDVPATPGWRDAEVDLATLAGERVELTLAVRPDRDGIVLGMAIGTPTVEGDPVDANAAKPDVVLVSLDTARRDRLSMYGAERPTTPHLERIARNAVVFETAIAPSSWTLPSHASVFTGQLPARHGVDRTDTRLEPLGAPHLGVAMRAAGYETIAFTAGGYVHPDFGFAAGFDRYVTTELVDFIADGETLLRSEKSPRMGELLQILQRPRRRPLFLFVHTYTAHNYITTDADLRAIGTDEATVASMNRVTRPDGARQIKPGVKVDHFPVFTAGTQLPKEDEVVEVDHLRRIYDATLLGADLVAGQVHRALEATGRLDHSYFVLFSDHGEELFEHGRAGHGKHLWEELVRVPLLFAGAGLDAARVDQVVDLCDIEPTLLDLLHLEPSPYPRDGRSLVPLLRGGALADEPAIGQEDRLLCIRGERYKLFARRDDTEYGDLSLYDVMVDPGEDRNVAAERKANAAELANALRRRVEPLLQQKQSGPRVLLSPERIAELKALGYLGGE